MNDREFAVTYREFQNSLQALIRKTKLPTVVKLSILRETEVTLGRYIQTLMTAEQGEEEKADGQDGDA